MSPANDPIAQSVHDRLLHLAKERKEDFNGILVRYGIERMLYRLTRTPHGKRFVLKGALLFAVWLERMHRPTRDLDLLGIGVMNESSLRDIFTDVCNATVAPDGMSFDPASINMEDIRQNQTYHGIRVDLRAYLGSN